MVNNCMFIGRLGRDPETRYTQAGKAVASFSIACCERFGGEKHTEWINVVAWEKLAEICGQYLHKGSLVYISGRMQTRKWQDQSGTDRYTTEIVAREMKMLDGKKDGGQQQENRNPQPQRMVPEQPVPF